MSEKHANAAGAETEFAARIDKIRARFLARLADRVRQTDAALPVMEGDGGIAVEATATAYRWFHDVSGIGSTIGFEATGRMARWCADLLIGPFREKRGLSPDELLSLTQGLEALRVAALSETHSTESLQRSVP